MSASEMLDGIIVLLFAEIVKVGKRTAAAAMYKYAGHRRFCPKMPLIETKLRTSRNLNTKSALKSPKMPMLIEHLRTKYEETVKKKALDKQVKVPYNIFRCREGAFAGEK